MTQCCDTFENILLPRFYNLSLNVERKYLFSGISVSERLVR